MTLSKHRLARYFAGMFAVGSIALLTQTAYAGSSQIASEVTVNFTQTEPTLGSVVVPLMVSGVALIAMGLSGAASIRRKR